jgi:hypothetical protein
VQIPRDNLAIICAQKFKLKFPYEANMLPTITEVHNETTVHGKIVDDAGNLVKHVRSL